MIKKWLVIFSEKTSGIKNEIFKFSGGCVICSVNSSKNHNKNIYLQKHADTNAQSYKVL